MAETISELLVKIGVELEKAKEAAGEIEKLTEETEEFGDTADKETKRAKRAFGNLSKELGKSLGEIREDFEKSFGTVEGLAKNAQRGAVAVAGAAAGVFAFVDAQTQALDATNKMSASLGLGAESLQRLEFAASQSGVGIDVLRPALTKLNQQMLEIDSGGGEAAKKVLDEIGVNFEHLRTLPLDDQLKTIADGLNTVGDQGRRAALSARIFGEEGGPRMATLLAEGSEGITKLGDSAGRVFSQEDLDRATEFQDRLGEVKREVTTLGQGIALDLLPPIVDGVESMRDWIQENDELIRQNVTSVIETLGGVVQETGEKTATAVKIFGELSDMIGKVDSAISSVVPEFKGLTSSFTTMISPISLVTSALTSLNEELFKAGIRSRVLEGGNAAAVQATVDAVLAADAKAKAATRSRGVGGGGLFGDLTDTLRGAAGAAAGAAGKLGLGAAKAGAAGAAAKTKEEKDKELLAPDAGLSVAEIVQRIRSGQFGRDKVLQQQLSLAADRSPAVADVKPTIAMDIRILNLSVESGAIKIMSADPAQSGRAVLGALSGELARERSEAAEDLDSTLLR